SCRWTPIRSASMATRPDPISWRRNCVRASRRRGLRCRLSGADKGNHEDTKSRRRKQNWVSCLRVFVVAFNRFNRVRELFDVRILRSRYTSAMARLLATLIVAMLSSGCLVIALQPAYDDESIVFEERLVGQGEDAEDKTS